MTARVVLDRASRARWLARRRKGLTATDVPAILGASPWRTPLGVWLEKVDTAPPVERRSPIMDRGHALEPWLAAEYERTHPGWFVDRPPMLVAHPDHPWLLASLDRVAHGPTETVCVELKTAHGDAWREWADGDMPDVYAIQCLVQAAVTGCDVVVWADVNGRIEERRVPRDPEWEESVIPLLHAWWTTHVVGRQYPPLDPIRDYPLLRRVWVPEPGTEVEATDAVMGAVVAHQKLAERITALDNLRTGLKSQIRQHMKTATALVDWEGNKLARVAKNGALTVTYTAPKPQEATA